MKQGVKQKERGEEERNKMREEKRNANWFKDLRRETTCGRSINQEREMLSQDQKVRNMKMRTAPHENKCKENAQNA
jgi:hypothetical protein